VRFLNPADGYEYVRRPREWPLTFRYGGPIVASTMSRYPVDPRDLVDLTLDDWTEQSAPIDLREHGRCWVLDGLVALAE
jgi:hypothetical protein